MKRRRKAALKEYGKRYGRKVEFKQWYEIIWKNPVKNAMNNEQFFILQYGREEKEFLQSEKELYE